jgi:glycosyltransferase involved in cell wall biosynthesis
MENKRPQETHSDAPLISVVTIVYNRVQYVEQTILSVLNQTYDKLEYIIIDGGSTDGTVNIISKYGSHLTYWHSKRDRGLAHALNLGLSQASGDWILFLHADDFLIDSMVIKMMVPYLISYKNYDVVFGETIRMTPQQDPKPLPLAKIWGSPWNWPEFRRKSLIPHPSAFTNRHYFDRVGGFDETFRLCMDYDHYLRGGKNLRAQYIPIKVSGMRAGGISRICATHALVEIMRALDMNNALPKGLIWLNFIGGIGRYYLGRVFHKFLDPFASKIIWPGRNSGRPL